MFTRYFTERRCYALSGLVLFALILAGCGGKAGTSTTTSVNNTISQQVPASPSASETGSTTATATLKHQPMGSASLNWEPTDHMLSVQLMLTGLAPNSVHPVHIDEGSCGSATLSNGATPNTAKALYPLVNATADAHGVINATSKVSVPAGIPAKNWYLEVYNGPGLSTANQATPIVCGDILNHDTSLRSAQSAQVSLEAPKNAANQDASGQAHLSLSNHTLTVQLEVSGLAPKSEHMVHIHEGTCASQGAVVYPLTTLTADASGKAVSTTTIQNVLNIPSTGWYVNVHMSNDLSNQTGFDPVACGNVVSGNA
ncbi:MAG TPA: CHRD domain-containing protein [Ktedonobacteraceae bacterium]